jgi:hypothetical protein
LARALEVLRDNNEDFEAQLDALHVESTKFVQQSDGQNAQTGVGLAI